MVVKMCVLIVLPSICPIVFLWSLNLTKSASSLLSEDGGITCMLNDSGGTCFRFFSKHIIKVMSKFIEDGNPATKTQFLISFININHNAHITFKKHKTNLAITMSLYLSGTAK